MACLCCWAPSRYTTLPDYDTEDGKPDGVYKLASNGHHTAKPVLVTKSTPIAFPVSSRAVVDSTNPLVSNALVIKCVSSFASAEGFMFVAGVSRHWRAAWNDEGRRTTSRCNAARSVSRLTWSKDCGLPWDEKTAGYAAALGGLEELKYVRSEGCPWNELTCNMAAAAGRLEVLRWCKENNCPFDRRYTCAAAAGRGHVDVVKWLQSNGCPWGKSTCEWAAGGGPIEKPVRWWNYKGAPDRLDTLGADPLDLSGSDLESGKRGGGSYWWYNIAGQAQKPRVKNQMRQLLVLKWCRRNGCPWDKKTCVNAAERGYLKVLRWCRENGCPWTKDVCDAAAFGGHLGVMQWCKANGCEWSEATCVAAAYGGHLAVLKWCREHGCSWQADRACQYAAWNGHLDVLRWCMTNGCSWNKLICEAAARGGHLKVLRWCRSNGCPWDEKTIAWAAFTRQAEIVDWCKAKGCPVGTFARGIMTAIDKGVLSDADIMAKLLA